MSARVLLSIRGDMTPLTTRQVQVLRLLAKGRTANQIAAELDITPGTAKQHMRDIRRRLDANNAPHAVYLALKHGIISTQDAA